MHLWGASRDPGNTKQDPHVSSWTMDEASCGRCLAAGVRGGAHQSGNTAGPVLVLGLLTSTTDLEPKLQRGSACRCWGRGERHWTGAGQYEVAVFWNQGRWHRMSPGTATGCQSALLLMLQLEAQRLKLGVEPFTPSFISQSLAWTLN